MEYGGNAGVIGKHQPGNAMRRSNIGRFSGESNLDGRWSPRNKLGQFSLTDPLKAFMNLSWIYLTLKYYDKDVGCIIIFVFLFLKASRICLHLNNVQNGSVAVCPIPIRRGGHHHILRLKQTSHNVKNCCFPDGCLLQRSEKR